MEDIKKIEDARERGRFEGQVLTSLGDIKIALNDMREKHIIQDKKIEQKADKEQLERIREELNENTKKTYYLAGMASVAGFILSKLF